MSKKPKQSISAQGAIRHNRDTGMVSIVTDDLPRPTRVFAAQLVLLGRIGSTILFHFAHAIVPRRLVAIAAIQMNEDSLPQLAKTLTPDFRASLASLGATSDEALVMSVEEIGTLPVDRIFVANANIGRMAIGAPGGQIDWYDFSPMDLHALAKGRSARSPAPVMSILLNNDLIATLVGQIDRETQRMGNSKAGGDEIRDTEAL